MDSVEVLLERQSGTIARWQVLAAGHSRDWWAWKLTRDWQGIGEGVAIAHRGHPQPEELRWAAVLHAGKDAALAGDAGLVHLGVRGLTVARYDVAVPDQRRVARVDVQGLLMQPHRVKRLDLWTATGPRLRVVHVHASALLAAEWASTDEEAEKRIAMVVQQRKSSVAQLRITFAQMPRLRRRALLAEVMDDVEFGAHANSELEYLRFCRKNGLPEPDEMQVAVRAGGRKYLDARYLKQRVHVEVDGAHHRWAEQWEADAMRTLELVVATKGEQQIRITRAMMRHHEKRTAELLRRILL